MYAKEQFVYNTPSFPTLTAVTHSSIIFHDLSPFSHENQFTFVNSNKNLRIIIKILINFKFIVGQ